MRLLQIIQITAAAVGHPAIDPHALRCFYVEHLLSDVVSHLAAIGRAFGTDVRPASVVPVVAVVARRP